MNKQKMRPFVICFNGICTTAYINVYRHRETLIAILKMYSNIANVSSAVEYMILSLLSESQLSWLWKYRIQNFTYETKHHSILRQTHRFD